MQMPDVTKAQAIGLIQAVVAVAVAFGAPITDTQSAALLGLAAVVAGVLFHSDAKIRTARAQIQKVREGLAPEELR